MPDISVGARRSSGGLRRTPTPVAPDAPAPVPVADEPVMNLSPLAIARSASVEDNKALAKSLGVSARGAEMDIAIRIWDAQNPDGDLCKALIGDFGKMSADELRKVGSKSSNKRLARCVGVSDEGTEAEITARIAEFLV